jgi:hypothetical protein
MKEVDYFLYSFFIFIIFFIFFLIKKTREVCRPSLVSCPASMV